MRIQVTDRSQAVTIEVYGAERERLIEEAQQAICTCYHYEFANAAPDLTKDELREIKDDPYLIHRNNGETWKDCPEWTQQRMEDLAEMEVDEHEQEKYLY